MQSILPSFKCMCFVRFSLLGISRSREWCLQIVVILYTHDVPHMGSGPGRKPGLLGGRRTPCKVVRYMCIVYALFALVPLFVYTNITSAWAVDREFFDIYLPLWLPGSVFGAPLASPGPTLGSILTLWGALGLPLDPFGLPLGSLWSPFGSLRGALRPQ